MHHKWLQQDEGGLVVLALSFFLEKFCYPKMKGPMQQNRLHLVVH
jgi:hypothetical protein